MEKGKTQMHYNPENKMVHSFFGRRVMQKNGQQFRVPTSLSYDESEPNQRRVEESVIVIDFFHPPEDRKKEIEARLATSRVS